VNIIETHNLTKIYKNKQIALNSANLKVPEGAVFGLLGPNGAGKTTTIRLLLGLHTPTAGSVMVFGEPMTPNAVDLRRRIGFLPTNPQFPKEMNPIEYLDFVGRLCGVPHEIRKPRLAGLLRAVDLLGASSQKVKGFSTGMTTRLGIAASLMSDPELLIWDEPTAGLDPEGHQHTIALIEELGQTKTILVSSHNLSDIKKVCDYVGILSDGKLIFNGLVRDMRQMARAVAIEIELEGDLDGFCQQLAAQHAALKWERQTNALRFSFMEGAVLAAELAQVLQIIAAYPAVTLIGVTSLQDEIVDAFINLLEEERAHGFSRIFDMAAADDAVHGGAASRPD